MELRDSSTVKIEFASNLLPEYISLERENKGKILHQ